MGTKINHIKFLFKKKLLYQSHITFMKLLNTNKISLDKNKTYSSSLCKNQTYQHSSEESSR